MPKISLRDEPDLRFKTPRCKVYMYKVYGPKKRTTKFLHSSTSKQALNSGRLIITNKQHWLWKRTHSTGDQTIRRAEFHHRNPQPQETDRRASARNTYHCLALLKIILGCDAGHAATIMSISNSDGDAERRDGS